MQYILVEFTDGLEQQAYQEVDDNGNLVGYKNLDGSLLELPTNHECRVIDSSPEFPVWGIKDTTLPQINFGTTQVGDEVILGDG